MDGGGGQSRALVTRAFLPGKYIDRRANKCGGTKGNCGGGGGDEKKDGKKVREGVDSLMAGYSEEILTLYAKGYPLFSVVLLL